MGLIQGANGVRMNAGKDVREMKHDTAEEFEALKKENERLHRELRFYKSAINALHNPVFLKDEELRYIFFNESYREFFELEEGQYIGMKVTDLPYLSDEDRKRYQNEDDEMLEKHDVIRYETTFENDESLRESLYWSKGFVAAETGQKGVIGEIVDISNEKKMQRELKRYISALEDLMEETKESSKTDPVTKLLNRRVFTEDLPEVVERARKNGDRICALMVDMDDFKSINDTYGHLVGDDILLTFADVMRSCFRSSDLLIRYGGDEFTVILVGADSSVAQPIAERFLDSVRKNVLLPNGESITISIGVAEMKYTDDMMDFFSRADEALYEAKNSGKNRVVIAEI